MAQADRPLEGASRADSEALPERIPFDGSQRVLQASREIPGYVLRVFNDAGGRIERAKRAGYVPVQRGEADLDDPCAGVSGSLGNEVSKPVGDGTRGVLMKIKKEYYDADQKAKQRKVDAVEATMKATAQSQGLREMSPEPFGLRADLAPKITR